MTKFVEWSDDLSVGIEEIDNQHKVLVGLINEMHEAIQQRRGRKDPGLRVFGTICTADRT